MSWCCCHDYDLSVLSVGKQSNLDVAASMAPQIRAYWWRHCQHDYMGPWWVCMFDYTGTPVDYGCSCSNGTADKSVLVAPLGSQGQGRRLLNPRWRPALASHQRGQLGWRCGRSSWVCGLPRGKRMTANDRAGQTTSDRHGRLI